MTCAGCGLTIPQWNAATRKFDLAEWTVESFNGEQQYFHKDCLPHPCDICAQVFLLAKNGKNYKPIEFGGNKDGSDVIHCHPDCFRCGTCHMAIPECKQDENLKWRYSLEPNWLRIDGVPYHKHCLPCEVCGIGGGDGDGHVKIFGYINAHVKCLKCMYCKKEVFCAEWSHNDRKEQWHDKCVPRGDCAECDKPMIVANCYTCADGKKRHYQCITCGICNTRTKYFINQGIVIDQDKTCHDTCFPCKKCKKQVYGKPVTADLVHVKC
jgi:hypothetical protein